MAEENIVNAFTVDVEDYFHVQAFENITDRKHWDDYECRVENNTRKILDLLNRHNVKGTFFILGWVAERYPQLVREIDDAGHEIGCHSYWHKLIYEMTPDEFREDLMMATKIIEEIISKPVKSFRAPCFSIIEKSLWALDVLIEEGFTQDSSIFPVHHDNYGIPNAERFPHVLERSNGALFEFPPSVSRFVKFNLPISGGGYFRLYPFRMSASLLNKINIKQNQPFMFYIHPWELDTDQPRMKAPLKSRFRHYQNLKTTERKLKKLLTQFNFNTMTEALEQRQTQAAQHETLSA